MADEAATTATTNGAAVNGNGVQVEKRPAESESAADGPALKKAKQTEDVSDLERKIIDQVEYYFGNINLPRDRFLLEEIKKDAGWVPLETMLKFNRLKTISDDEAAISAALRKSTSGLLEVADTNDKVRRAVPMPENSLEYWKEIKRRSVYVKGFPPNTTLDQIRDSLKGFGQLEQVLMRRVQGADRIFKGSVFATYKTVDECQKLVNEEKVVFGDIELLREMQEDYTVRKQKSVQEARQKQKEEKRNRKLTNLKFSPGCLVKVSGVPTEGEQWQNLKSLFAEHASVSRVEHEATADTAVIRLEAPKDDKAEATPAEALVKKLDGKIEYKDGTLTVEVITGEPEKDYYIAQDKAKREREEQRKKKQKQRNDDKRKNHRHDKRDRANKRAGTASEAATAAAAAAAAPEGKKTVFADSDSSGDEAEQKPTNVAKATETVAAAVKDVAKTETEAVVKDE